MIKNIVVNRFFFYLMVIFYLCIAKSYAQINYQKNYIPDPSFETIKKFDTWYASGKYYWQTDSLRIGGIDSFNLEVPLVFSPHWWYLTGRCPCITPLNNNSLWHTYRVPSFYGTYVGSQKTPEGSFWKMKARTGTAYITPCRNTYSKILNFPGTPIEEFVVKYYNNTIQYYATKLTEPLQQNIYYYVYQHVYNYKGHSDLLSNTNAMRFYADSFRKEPVPPLVKPYVRYCESFYALPDTIDGVMYKNYGFPSKAEEWQKIAFVYKAQGTEKVLAIGNFVPPSKRIYIFPEYMKFTRSWSFLLNAVDDIGVVPLGDLDNPLRGKDTLIDVVCKTFSITLNAELNPFEGRFLWSTGATSNSIVVQKEGDYGLKYFLQDTVFNYTFKIEKPKELNYNYGTSVNYLFIKVGKNLQLNLPAVQFPNSIKIYDNMGRILINKQNVINELDLNYLQAGLYRYVYTDICNTIKNNFVVLGD